MTADLHARKLANCELEKTKNIPLSLSRIGGHLRWPIISTTTRQRQHKRGKNLETRERGIAGIQARFVALKTKQQQLADDISASSYSAALVTPAVQQPVASPASATHMFSAVRHPLVSASSVAHAARQHSIQANAAATTAAPASNMESPLPRKALDLTTTTAP